MSANNSHTSQVWRKIQHFGALICQIQFYFSYKFSIISDFDKICCFMYHLHHHTKPFLPFKSVLPSVDFSYPAQLLGYHILSFAFLQDLKAFRLSIYPWKSLRCLQSLSIQVQAPTNYYIMILIRISNKRCLKYLKRFLFD